MSADPVSWLVIERGWRVVGSDGEEIGHVDEVVGDSGADIFNGLSISKGLLAGQRYVPSEQVKSIVEGCVELDMPAEVAERLGEYEQPAPSEEILPPDRES